MIHSFRKIAARVAERRVRSLSSGMASSLMMEAAGRESAHRGNSEWMNSNARRFSSVYLVPLGSRLRSADVRCVVVLFGLKSEVVWMTLDVSPWKLFTLRRAGSREVLAVIGKLASNYPVVKWDGSV